MNGVNWPGVWAIFHHEMTRFFRTIMQSLLSPVVSTVLYFVVFGAAIGGRIQSVEGVEYGAFIVPGLMMLTILQQSVSNASFGIYFPKFSGTIYEYLVSPVGWVEITLGFVGAAAVKAILIAFLISYGANTLKMPSEQLLLIGTLAAVSWFIFTLLGGILGDKIGRVRCFQIGYGLMVLWAVPMWFLIDSKNLLLFFVSAVGLTIALGLSYGPQAALYAELFPAKVRYSGVSIGYALGAIFGGAFAPMIAQWIIGSYGESWRVGVYIAVLALISLITVSTIKDPQGVDLNVNDAGT